MKRAVVFLSLFLYLFGIELAAAQKGGSDEGSIFKLLEGEKAKGNSKIRAFRSASEQISGERARFISEAMSFFPTRPLAVIYVDGVTSFIEGMKRFQDPLVSPYKTERKIARVLRNFSFFFKKNFKTLDELVSFLGLYPTMPGLFGVFRVRPGNRLGFSNSYGISFILHLKNSDRFLHRLIEAFKKNPPPQGKELYHRGRTFVYKANIRGSLFAYFAVKGKIFALNFIQGELDSQLVKWVRSRHRPSLSARELFTFPVNRGDIYFYGDMEQFFRLVQEYAARGKKFGRGVDPRMVKALAKIIEKLFSGLSQLHGKLSVSQKSFEVKAAIKYGKSKSKFVKKLSQWQSKPISSRRLIPPNTFILLSLNSLGFYLDFYDILVEEFKKHLDQLVPKHKMSDAMLLLMVSSTFTTLFKTLVDDEVTVAVGTSKDSPIQIALLIKTFNPKAVLKQMTPLFLKTMPQLKVVDVGYKGFLYQTLKKKEGVSGQPPRISIAWAAFKNYAVVTLEFGNRYRLMTDLIERTKNKFRILKLSEVEPLLFKKTDLLLYISFRNVLKFIKNFPEAKSAPQIIQSLPIIKLFDSIFLRTESVTGRKNFYYNELKIIKK